eukprot:5401981-Prymnesium_polylepis.1
MLSVPTLPSGPSVPRPGTSDCVSCHAPYGCCRLTPSTCLHRNGGDGRRAAVYRPHVLTEILG